MLNLKIMNQSGKNLENTLKIVKKNYDFLIVQFPQDYSKLIQKNNLLLIGLISRLHEMPQLLLLKIMSLIIKNKKM